MVPVPARDRTAESFIDSRDETRCEIDAYHLALAWWLQSATLWDNNGRHPERSQTFNECR